MAFFCPFIHHKYIIMFQRALLLFLSLSLITCIKAYSQADPNAFGYYQDALRYSQINFGGTARMMSIGGAQTSLGGDIGSVAVNPATLGFYRRSEFTISPTLGIAGTSTNANPTGFYEPSKVTDGRTNLALNNVAAVFARPKDDITPGAWRGGAWSIGLTRLNNFSNRFAFEGNNYAYGQDGAYNPHSIVDYYLENAQRYDDFAAPDDQRLPSFLRQAYQAFLIDTLRDRDGFFYYSEPDFVSDQVRQRGTVDRRGGQTQIDIAYGGNFGDRFYIGGSLGIQRIRYSSNTTYTETSLDPTSALRRVTLEDDYSASGSGVNLTLGAIYRLSDIVRLGASVKTPTFFVLNESFSTALTTEFANYDYFGDGSYILRTERPDILFGEFNYRLTTPLRINTGASVFAGKNGFISADVEYVNYGSARINSNEVDFSADNNSIRGLYGAAYNFRLGGEYRIGIFRARLGGAYYGSPYTTRVDNEMGGRLFLTGGVGVRQANYFLDLGVVNSGYNSFFQPFTLNNGGQPNADVRNGFTQVAVTLGTFF
jgi:hypothetical protein